MIVLLVLIDLIDLIALIDRIDLIALLDLIDLFDLLASLVYRRCLRFVLTSFVVFRHVRHFDDCVVSSVNMLWSWVSLAGACR